MRKSKRASHASISSKMCLPTSDHRLRRRSKPERKLVEGTMQSKKAIVIAALCLLTTGAVLAKLPPLNDEQKAKAEEAKAKAAETAKKDAELLAKSQDRVTDRYIKEQKAKGVVVKPTPIAAAPTPPAATPPAPTPTAKK